MTRKSLRALIKSDLEHFGLVRTVYDLALRTVNRVALLKIFKGVRIDVVHPDFLELEPGFRAEFLGESLLREFARNPQCELPDEFLDAALAKGDECYAILDGPTLAAYGWYSNQPTEASDGLEIVFSSDFMYMYKGFTHPKYRGRRLHAIGMNRALREYLARGFRGLVSYVESNNFSSLKSCYRIGYQDIGRVLAVRLAGRPMTVAGRGCRPYGFGFRPLPKDGTSAKAASKPAEQRRAMAGAGA
jgi:hypothetical protein